MYIFETTGDDNNALLKKIGPIDNNGYECPVSCPTKCGSDELSCNGGKDPSGCQNQDFCVPSKGGTKLS